jgi:hypothetical protein
MTTDSIRIIFVKMEVDGRQNLCVLLAQDGLVNRLGTGTVNNSERDLFIGHTNEPLFTQLRDKLRPEWLAHGGTYDIPNKIGRTCTLTILVQDAGGQGYGVGFRYGSRSQGPPLDICQFVTEAVRLTDPWYEQQKSMVSGRPSTRPWWKAW